MLLYGGNNVKRMTNSINAKRSQSWENERFMGKQMMSEKNKPEVLPEG